MGSGALSSPVKIDDTILNAIPTSCEWLSYFTSGLSYYNELERVNTIVKQATYPDQESI